MRPVVRSGDLSTGTCGRGEDFSRVSCPTSTVSILYTDVIIIRN